MLNYSILLAAWVLMVWLAVAGILRTMSLKETGLARRRPRMAGLTAVVGGLGMLPVAVGFPLLAWSHQLHTGFGVIGAIGTSIAVIGMLVLAQWGLRTINGIPIAAFWLGSRPWLYTVMAWLGLILLIFILDATTRSRLTRMAKEIATAQKAMQPAVVPERNARDDYLTAFAIMGNVDRELMDWLTANEATSPPPALSEPVRRAVSLLRAAASKPQVAWGDELSQEIAHPVGYLKLFRQGTSLLRIDALNSAKAGQMHEAIADVRAMEQIARHVGQGPTLIEGLVAIGIQGLADATVSDLLPSAKQVEDLQNLTSPDGQWYRLVRQRMLDGEKLDVTGQFIDMAFGKLPGKAGDTRMSAPAAAVYRFLLVEMDISAWQKQMDRLLDVISLEARQALVRARQLEQEWKSRGMRNGIMPSILLQSTGTTTSATFRAELGSELRNVAIAIRKYRLENNVWPTSLEDLLKRGYLQHVPLDLYSNGPILMATKPEGVVVYSVGENGKDDGGTGQRNEDITFVVSDKPLWERDRQ